MQSVKYNTAELAQRFDEMGEKFLLAASTIPTQLDFKCERVTTDECGTVACHGGFASVVLDPNMRKGFGYMHGANLVAKYLGFSSMSGYTIWSSENPTVWGCDNGYYMFTAYGHQAFGITDSSMGHLVDLNVIGQWYKNVARRLRGQRPEAIKYAN